LERGEQGGAQAIPPTLAQSLTARLDRLGPPREVAMTSAVLGRGFSYSLLRAVVGVDEAPLHEALDRLAEADILLVEGLPPDAEYRFKHALIQDAAYENLLKSRRQALHRRVAETLRDHFPDRREAEPEVLAHHFTEAGLTDAAIEYWGKAGDQALRRSAFQEAIAHLGKAIAMADKGEGGTRTAPAGRADGQRQLQLQTNYSKAVMWSRGFGAEETQAAFARAHELATGVDSADERFDAYYGQYVRSLFRGELRSARETAETFLREAEKKGGMTETAAARRSLGLACLFQGDFPLARTHLQQALRLFDPERDRDAKFRFGPDGGVGATSYLALTNWQLGEAELTLNLIEAAIAGALESAHAPTLTNAYFTEALLDALRGDAEAARRAAESGLEVGRAHGLGVYLVFGALLSAWATARLSDRVTGMTELRKAMAAYAEQGNKFHVQLFQGLLAELEAEGQEAQGSVARIDGALALAEQTDQHWTDALLHRIRGDILLKADPASRAHAEEAYLAAIAVAREQGARSFGLQAALRLAKFYQSTARPVEAHDVLAPALEGFSPTPEMPEIAEAQALQAALAEDTAKSS
jgi:predicted ATPase